MFERSYGPGAGNALTANLFGVKNNEVLRHKPFRQRSSREPVSRTTKFFAKSLPGNKLAGSRHRERQSSLLKIKAFLATSLPEAGIENVKVLC